jgi:hypothetical protein
MKLKGEAGVTFIFAIGDEGESTINRYNENAAMSFLCQPHDLIDFKVINEIDFNPEDSNELDYLEAFEVLEVYGNPETNYSEMNEAFEMLWNK